MQSRSSRENASGKPSVRRYRVLFLACAVSASVSAAGWEEKLYNPQPLDDDVILPMPCEGAMAFRKIETEAGGVLDDQEVFLGSDDPSIGYKENRIKTHIAGSFPGDTPRIRYFLLGKYEVTELQFQAVMAGGCPGPSADGRLPQTEVTWFEAVNFAHKYTLWLLENARERLPRDGDAIGFTRLPTEAEWEFAARGGRRVSAAEFKDKLFPMTEDINQYVWFQGTRSAQGRAQFIGVLKPNPLGLHDILGNVDEITFELFRLTKHSRLHGQAGAYVVRGGNYLIPSESIRTAYRQEVPFYKDKASLTNTTTGMRVAITGPAISRKNLPAIVEEWAASNVDPETKPAVCTAPARAPPPVAGVVYCPPAALDIGPQPLGDPMQELIDLTQNATDPNLKKRLEGLRASLAANIEARNEQRDHAAREALRSTSIMCQKLHVDGINIRSKQKLRDALCQIARDARECDEYAKPIESYRSTATYNLEVYADAVVGLQNAYPMDVLARQKDLLVSSIEARPYKDLIPFVQHLSEHLQAYARDGKLDHAAWYQSCVSVRPPSDQP